MTSAEPSLVIVDRLPTSYPADGSLVYRVEATQQSFSLHKQQTVAIEVVSSLTGQRNSVAVTVTPSSQSNVQPPPMQVVKAEPPPCAPAQTTAPVTGDKSVKPPGETFLCE